MTNGANGNAGVGGEGISEYFTLLSYSTLYKLCITSSSQSHFKVELHWCETSPISILTSNLPGLSRASSIRSGLLVIPEGGTDGQREERGDKRGHR